MRNFGFIKPEDITILDYKLSMAKCQEEEETLRKEDEHEDVGLFESDY